MPSFDQAFGIHAQAVALRGARAEVLATNLANADTPGYHARDIDFREVLKREAGAGDLQVTHARHIDGRRDSAGGFRTGYRHPEQASLDQNTVDVQAERSAFLDNAMRYQASVQFLNGRITGLITALRGE